MIKIQVPATSANVGCGFDCLGMAVSLYATFTFEKSEMFKVTGCPTKYQNEDNLVLQAYKKVFEKLHKEIIPVSLTIESELPVSRGLGSSATCIVGGIYGANAILNHPLTKQECLEIATEMEGHPDNVAPAIFGNLCASFMDEKVVTTQFQASQNIKLLAMIPDFEVSTQKAREILPKQVSYKDAIYSLSRVASLCKALEENNHENIHYACKDKLHEPYRKQLIHEFDELKEICKDETAFFISGSGSTCMCIYKNDCTEIIEKVKQLKHNWTCIPLIIDREGVKEL